MAKLCSAHLLTNEHLSFCTIHISIQNIITDLFMLTFKMLHLNYFLTESSEIQKVKWTQGFVYILSDEKFFFVVVLWPAQKRVYYV